MKQKTLEKITRRFRALPLHHVDTSVILESFFQDAKYAEECKQYLNKIGYKYRGELSISVIGEVFVVIETDVKEAENKELFFRFFDSLIKRRKTMFATGDFNAYDLTAKIKNIETRIEPSDALHLAIAIQHKANVFVTLDEKIIHNRDLEKEFGIKILHPSEL